MVPVLTYFDMRGRAEASRLLLADAGIEFVDRRIKSEKEWTSLQPTLPAGKLPLFNDDKVQLTESHAILRHLARVARIEPSNSADIARFDEVHEALAETQRDLWLSTWVEIGPYDDSAFATVTLPRRLAGLASLLTPDAGTFWFGSKPSRVDFLAFALLDEIDAFVPDVLGNTPALANLYQSVSERPGVRNYLDSGRRPAVFGMGKTGPKIDPRLTYKAGEVFECPWREPIPLDKR